VDPDGLGRSNRIGLIIGLVVGGVVFLAMLITVLVLVLGSVDSPESRVRIAAERAETQNNLKQIALATLNYESAYRRMPPAVVYGPDKKPLYSWRVLLLPYLEEAALYREFHLNEPWDSPHNHKLLTRMPKVYSHPRKASTTDTHYQVFFGRGAAFEGPEQSGFTEFRLLPEFQGQLFEGRIVRIADITDGTSNTILVAEAAQAVPWTKPVDLPFDPSGALPPLGGLFPDDSFNICMVDGSSRQVHLNKVTERTLRFAITRAGGEPLDWNE
jgi:hypothetical protein